MDVALKLLNMDHVEMDQQLETFRREVRSLIATRHDNIVLFIGCCLVPPYLGIVMDYCQGPTLHELIHGAKKLEQPLPRSQVLAIAVQICQGMSYLHCKKILHKDLRSKNVFLQSRNKVLISDFGIFSCQRLFTKNEYEYGCSRIFLPQYWLQYQSPEIIRSLNAPSESIHHVEELSFSEASDVFAFGSLWYELLSFKFPYTQLPHQLIWRVGIGNLAPPSNHAKLQPDDDNILNSCWEFNAHKRPSFLELSSQFDSLIGKVKARLRKGRSLPMSP